MTVGEFIKALEKVKRSSTDMPLRDADFTASRSGISVEEGEERPNEIVMELRVRD